MNYTTTVVTIRETARIRELKALMGTHSVAQSAPYVSSFCPGSQNLQQIHKESSQEERDYLGGLSCSSFQPFSPASWEVAKPDFRDQQNKTKNSQQNTSQLYFLTKGPTK